MEGVVSDREEQKFVLLMATLPSSYDHLITTLIYGKVTLEFEVVPATLISFEKQNKVRGGESQALIVDNRGRSKNWGERNHNDKSRGRLKLRDKNFILYHCRKLGHIKKNCRVLKREE